MEKKLTNRQRKALETKDNIYNSAIRLFKERGFIETSTRDIAKDVGVSQGTLFIYYKSKEDFLLEFFSRAEKEYALEYENLKSDSARDRIIEYTEIVLNWQQFIIGYKFMSIIFNKQLSYTTEKKIFTDMDRPSLQTMLRIIQDGQTSGELKSQAAPEYILELIMMAVRGAITDWCMHNGEYNLFDKAKQLIILILEYYSVD